MSYVLSPREQTLLKALTHAGPREFMIKGELPVGVGPKSLDQMQKLGLIEKSAAASFRGDYGYRLTLDGHRCMYGLTEAEMLALPGGSQAEPLLVWKWPQTGKPRIFKS